MEHQLLPGVLEVGLHEDQLRDRSVYTNVRADDKRRMETGGHNPDRKEIGMATIELMALTVSGIKLSLSADLLSHRKETNDDTCERRSCQYARKDN